MTISSASLVDTNVLVYAADETSQFYRTSRTLRDKALNGEVRLCIFPQILYEFFAIITDPRRVNNPRSQNEAIIEVEKYYNAERIIKLYSGPDIIDITINLSKRYEVKRQEIFDLQLVASMLSNGVSRIFTFNREHFKKYKEIEALEP